MKPFRTTFNNLNSFDEKRIEEIRKRFWSKVNKNGPVRMGDLGECWEWIAWKFPGGYGGINIRSRNVRANRLSYILTYGEIPEGLGVLHKCNYPSCCRPDHLYLGNAQENATDREKSPMSIKGERNGSCLHPDSRLYGEKINTVKLTTSLVVEIRSLYKFGEITLADIAKRYNVNRSTLGRLVRGKSWKRAPGTIFEEPTVEQLRKMKSKAALVGTMKNRERKTRIKRENDGY